MADLENIVNRRIDFYLNEGFDEQAKQEHIFARLEPVLQKYVQKLNGGDETFTLPRKVLTAIFIRFCIDECGVKKDHLIYLCTSNPERDSAYESDNEEQIKEFVAALSQVKDRCYGNLYDYLLLLDEGKITGKIVLSPLDYRGLNDAEISQIDQLVRIRIDQNMEGV